jgi:L-malate glycosyltransferase
MRLTALSEAPASDTCHVDISIIVVQPPASTLRAMMIRRPVRVCLMTDTLCAAGVELQLLLLLKWLDRKKIFPCLCLLDGSDPKSRALEPHECPVIRLGIQRLRHVRSAVAAWRLACFLRQERIDVMHPLVPDSLYFAAPVAKIAGVPCLAGFRVGIEPWRDSGHHRFVRRIYHMLDGIVANCEACRSAAIAEQGVAADSVAIIPNGIDL